jgi:hypothetical protein
MSNSEEMTDSRNAEETPASEEISPEDAGRKRRAGRDRPGGAFRGASFLSKSLCRCLFLKNSGWMRSRRRYCGLAGRRYEKGTAHRIVEISNGFQFMTSGAILQIRSIMGYAGARGFPRGSLDFSIIAYKQPIVLAESRNIGSVVA